MVCGDSLSCLTESLPAGRQGTVDLSRSRESDPGPKSYQDFALPLSHFGKVSAHKNFPLGIFRVNHCLPRYFGLNALNYPQFGRDFQGSYLLLLLCLPGSGRTTGVLLRAETNETPRLEAVVRQWRMASPRLTWLRKVFFSSLLIHK